MANDTWSPGNRNQAKPRFRLVYRLRLPLPPLSRGATPVNGRLSTEDGPPHAVNVR
jgi:hypothetical protein